MAKNEVNVIIKARDRASAKFKKVGQSGINMGNMLKTAAATAGVALGAAGFVRAFTSIIKAGSVAEETASKFNAVFKEEAAAAMIFGKELAGAVGRSKVEMQGFLATLQDTFVPLGFARGEARKMSQTMVKLAIDLASFNNTADADTIRDLQSAIVGNHETMRKYGVIITQSTLSQELLNMGMAGGALKATEQQKAQARLNLIMKGTTDAQGDAVRTAGGFANQWKKLKARLTDGSVAISKFLLPSMTSLVNWTNSLTLASAKSAVKIGIWVASISGAVLVAPKIVAAIKAIVKGIKALVTAQTIMQSFAGPAGWATLAISVGIAVAAITAMTLKFDDLNSEFKQAGIESDQVVNSLNSIKDAADTAANSVGNAGDRLNSFFSKERILAIKDANKQLENLKERVGNLGKSKSTLFSEMLAKAYGMEVLPIIKEEVSPFFEQEDQFKKAAEQAEIYKDTIAELRDEIETFGKTTQEVKLIHLIKSGATKEQIETARVLVNKITELQELKKRGKIEPISQPPLVAQESRFLTMAGRRDPAIQTEKNTSIIAKATTEMAKEVKKLADKKDTPVGAGIELEPSDMY